ncbi:MAG: response regulator, partial [Chthonomonadales bacterium]
MNDNHVPRVDTAGQSLSPEVLHELRTPLNQIIGYSEMLAEQAQEEGQTGYLPDLEKIRKAGRHMVAMLGSGAPQLPAAVRPSEMPKKSDSATLILGPASVDHPKAMILIVDDNEMNRDVLSRRLQRQGYEFDVAGSGRSALEMVKDRNFDLVMLDIMMPDMDGYEVLTRLKADETTRHVPVIMISALDELESVVRCIVLGAEDYLPKPFEPTLLKARINACLEKKWSHDREAKLYEQLQLSFVRLQELEKSRDDLTNMIVHDLRTPLTSLLTGMQTLDGDQGLDDFQREMVGI